MKYLSLILMSSLLFGVAAKAQVRVAILKDWDAKSFRKAVREETRIRAVNKETGRSHLHTAAAYNRALHIPVLLEHLASMLTKRDSEGLTPIEIAMLKGNLSAFMALVNYYNVHKYRTENKYHWSLAHWAARFNQPAMLRELGARGIDINVLDTSTDPWTPLDLANAYNAQAAADVIRALGGVSAKDL